MWHIFCGSVKCSNEISETFGQNGVRKSEKKTFALASCSSQNLGWMFSISQACAPPSRIFAHNPLNLIALRPCPMLKIRGRTWAAKRGVLRDESCVPGKIEETSHVNSREFVELYVIFLCNLSHSQHVMFVTCAICGWQCIPSIWGSVLCGGSTTNRNEVPSKYRVSSGGDGCSCWNFDCIFNLALCYFSFKPKWNLLEWNILPALSFAGCSWPCCPRTSF